MKKIKLLGLIIGFLAMLFSALKLATDATEYYYDYHTEYTNYMEGNDNE